MIAIIGATGYIGSSLSRAFVANGAKAITLFARNHNALTRMGWLPHVSVQPLSEFNAERFDLVVNAIGAGDPARVSSMGADIVELTKVWDRRVLETMNATTRYVFLSSGAIYGDTLDSPLDGNSMPLAVPTFKYRPSAYVEGKLAAEASHRALPTHSILDLRVFGFADQSIPLDGTSFLADLARNVAAGSEFVTSLENMVRDYAGTEELYALIKCWLTAGAPNRPLDLYTQNPVSKLALIERAQARYGLSVRYSDQVQASPTGLKPTYASRWHAAGALGYAPTRDSMQVVTDMLDSLARNRPKSQEA